ncbi:MAG: pyridoxamine kinase [Clostridiales bacterium]|nr:pyridoxamine kinase [Clostridiales bacterium]
MDIPAPRSRPPRVAAVHDLSGIGRCALCAIIPAMSALGVQVCPIPTALLSTQTDGFEHFTFRDLTDEVLPIYAHWRSLDLLPDCIYSGFLGSIRQIDILDRIFAESGEGTFKVVDPVMGDDGALYSTHSPEMGYKMRRLCSGADLITPNLTECIYLIDRPYRERPFTREEIKGYLKDLCALGAGTAVLTGVSFEPGRLANCAFDSRSNRFYEAGCTLLPQRYPGTGDLFTSVLTGLLLRGFSLEQGLRSATDYLSATIAATCALATPAREGVVLEQTLGLLTALVAPV